MSGHGDRDTVTAGGQLKTLQVVTVGWSHHRFAIVFFLLSHMTRPGGPGLRGIDMQISLHTAGGHGLGTESQSTTIGY